MRLGSEISALPQIAQLEERLKARNIRLEVRLAPRLSPFSERKQDHPRLLLVRSQVDDTALGVIADLG